MKHHYPFLQRQCHARTGQFLYFYPIERTGYNENTRRFVSGAEQLAEKEGNNIPYILMELIAARNAAKFRTWN